MVRLGEEVESPRVVRFPEHVERGCLWTGSLGADAHVLHFCEGELGAVEHLWPQATETRMDWGSRHLDVVEHHVLLLLLG